MLNFAAYNKFLINKFSNVLKIENWKLKIFWARIARSGQVAMSLIFLIGGVMIVIAATLTFVVSTYLNATIGYRSANQALSIASSGVDDAVLQLTRNKGFSSSGYCVPISCGATSTLVIVTSNTPQYGQATITSDAKINQKERKIRAVVSVASSSQITIISWQLLSL